MTLFHWHFPRCSPSTNRYFFIAAIYTLILFRALVCSFNCSKGNPLQLGAFTDDCQVYWPIYFLYTFHFTLRSGRISKTRSKMAQSTKTKGAFHFVTNYQCFVMHNSILWSPFSSMTYSFSSWWKQLTKINTYR